MRRLLAVALLAAAPLPAAGQPVAAPAVFPIGPNSTLGVNVSVQFELVRD